MVHVAFDTRELYYLTQYLPVHRELARRGVESSFVAYHNRPEALEAMRRAFESARLPVTWFESKEAGLEHYKKLVPDWAVFGNGYAYTAELPERTRTAMLYHGIGMKSDVYAPQLVEHDVRFVEGRTTSRAWGSCSPARTWSRSATRRRIRSSGPRSAARASIWRRRARSAQADGDVRADALAELVRADERRLPGAFRRLQPDRQGALPLLLRLEPQSHRRLMELWSRAPNCYVVPLEQFDPVPFMVTADPVDQ
jgi:hypothetical protein